MGSDKARENDEGSVRLPLANGKYRQRARMLAGFLGVLALAIWLFHFYLWYQYDVTRSSQVEASSSNIYPLNTHGHVVYLTKVEDATLTELTILALSLFTIAFLIDGLFADGLSQGTRAWEKKGGE